MASICINFTFLPFHKSLQENIEMGDIDKEIRLAKSLVSSAGPVNIMIIHHIFIFCYSDPFLRPGKFLINKCINLQQKRLRDSGLRPFHWYLQQVLSISWSYIINFFSATLTHFWIQEFLHQQVHKFMAKKFGKKKVQNGTLHPTCIIHFKSMGFEDTIVSTSEWKLTLHSIHSAFLQCIFFRLG